MIPSSSFSTSFMSLLSSMSLSFHQILLSSTTGTLININRDDDDRIYNITYNNNEANTNDNNNSNVNDNNDCGELCGWVAAFCAMLAFGTFGVPIKSQAALSVDVDPLVFQSYKTFMCFITSWIVLLMGEEFNFTPWGIVSGLFWVPGGVATIYAVKAAGLAIGIGIGSSFIVLISFIWGIFVFNERVHSKIGACFAIFCMMVGLIGMSYFSSPNLHTIATTTDTTDVDLSNNHHVILSAEDIDDVENEAGEEDVVDTDDDTTNMLNKHSKDAIGIHDDTHLDSNTCLEAKPSNTMSSSSDKNNVILKNQLQLPLEHTDVPTVNLHRNLSYNSLDNENTGINTTINNIQGFSTKPYSHLSFSDYSSRSYNNNIYVDDNSSIGSPGTFRHHGHPANRNMNGGSTSTIGNRHENLDHQHNGLHIPICCCFSSIYLTKRQLGMLAAAFCGIYGGSILAPMKFANTNTKGTHYLISFAIGATIVTITLWIIRFLYNSYKYNSFYIGYNALPSFHIRVMWLAGGTSGLLWSIGNYFSLISVLYLGEGIGYPLVQTSILVSGLWGIFYFKEVQGFDAISKWLLSSLLTIGGILLLSYEHLEK